MKKVYFLSDAHLGGASPSATGVCTSAVWVRFLDCIKQNAAAVYLLGDMFDFWHEYRTVVPKGFTRFLGKVERADRPRCRGTFFHRKPRPVGRRLPRAGSVASRCIATAARRKSTATSSIWPTATGWVRRDRKYRMLRRLFHNPTCQASLCRRPPALGGGLLGARVGPGTAV